MHSKVKSPRPQPAAALHEFNLREYLMVFYRKWYILAVSFALFLLGGVLFTYRQPKIYRATALVAVTPPRSKTIGKVQIDEGAAVYSQEQLYVNTQLEIIKSRTFIHDVIKDVPAAALQALLGKNMKTFELDAFLENNLDIATKRNTTVLVITCLGYEPAACATIANLIAKKFIERNKKKAETDQSAMLRWLSREIPSIRDNMAKTKKVLLKFEKNNKEILFGFREKEGFRMPMLERLDQELENVKIEYLKAAVCYEKCQKARKIGTLQPLLALSFFENDTMIQELRKQKFELEKKLAEELLVFRREHPSIQHIEVKIKQLQEKISGEIEIVVRRQEQKYKELQTIKQRLERMLHVQQAKNLAFREKYSQYEHYRREYDALQKTYISFVEKVKELNSVVNYHIDNIELIDRAYRPKLPYKPNKLINYLLSGMLGIIIGIAIIVLGESLDETVQNQEQIEEIFSASVLGFVPYIPKEMVSGDISHVVEEKDNGNIVEAFRAIGTSIFFSGDQNGDRSLVITSALAQDGKSTILSNLGFTIAKAGHRVLIVDGDLRRPRLHKLFAIDNHSGFAQVLQDGADLQANVHQINANLWCLPAGKIPKDAYESIHKGKLADIIRQMHENYHYVLIDTPPMGITNEALLLGKAAHGIVFLVSLQKSHRKMLGHLAQRLQRMQLPLKGIIINDIKGYSARRHSYYYNNYYHNSYYHDE